MPQDRNDDATSAPTSQRDRPWVIATWPGGTAHCDLPTEGTLVIGRGDDCGLVIPHRSVSRRHARIAIGPPLTIEDLGSANGTKLRGKFVTQRTPTAIEEGMAIEVGDVALLVRAMPPADAPAPSSHLAGELARVERERIIDALSRCGGNQTRAAALLGISRRTLVSRLDEYDLPRPLKGPK